MITYPNFLPTPLIKSSEIRQQNNITRTEMDVGLPRQRQINHKPIYVYNMEVNLSTDNLSLWHAWHSREAKSGAAWFKIDLLTGDIIREKTARFLGNYSFSPRSDQLWKVKFSLEILDVDSISDNTLGVALGTSILLADAEKLSTQTFTRIELAFAVTYKSAL